MASSDCPVFWNGIGREFAQRGRECKLSGQRRTAWSEAVDLKSSRRFIFGTKGGKVKFIGLATKQVAKNKKSLKRYLKLGGFR